MGRGQLPVDRAIDVFKYVVDTGTSLFFRKKVIRNLTILLWSWGLASSLERFTFQHLDGLFYAKVDLDKERGFRTGNKR